jgi:hypothetical protein
MATPTYTALATTTLSGGETEVTFSSIPNTFRDVVLVIAGSSSTASGLTAKINGSTADMQTVYMYADGSNDASGAAGNVSVIGQIDSGGGVSTTHFLDYSATNKHKTFLTRGSRAGGIVIAYANRWGQTAAINSIAMTMQAGSLNSGTVISLYGIEA